MTLNKQYVVTLRLHFSDEVLENLKAKGQTPEDVLGEMNERGYVKEIKDSLLETALQDMPEEDLIVEPVDVEELTDKHREECRQIALYDDQLRKAVKLLESIGEIHRAAIRENCGVKHHTGLLMTEADKLLRQIRDSEHRGEVSGSGSNS